MAPTSMVEAVGSKVYFNGIWSVYGIAGCNIVFLGNFLLNWSDTFAVGWIIYSQYTVSQTDRRTDRPILDDSIMPIADHTACSSTIGYKA